MIDFLSHLQFTNIYKLQIPIRRCAIGNSGTTSIIITTISKAVVKKTYVACIPSDGCIRIWWITTVVVRNNKLVYYLIKHASATSNCQCCRNMCTNRFVHIAHSPKITPHRHKRRSLTLRSSTITLASAHACRCALLHAQHSATMWRMLSKPVGTCGRGLVRQSFRPDVRGCVRTCVCVSVLGRRWWAVFGHQAVKLPRSTYDVPP